MRNMSFMYTQGAVKDESKLVTRRLGWKNLKPGELFQGVEKSQGLGKGGKIKKLKVCRCISNTTEELYDILRFPVRDDGLGRCECDLEGFPAMTPMDFIHMFMGHMGCERYEKVQRIRFEYVKE